jgi:hypothetical protein
MADAQKLLMLGAVGVGGYFLYDWWAKSKVAPAGQPPPPGTTGGGQPTSVTASSTMQALALNMQQALGQASGNPDQWDWAFASILGTPIDQKYNFNFDAVYGLLPARTSTAMNAMMFLQLAATAKGGLPGLSGLGSAIVRFSGPQTQTTGNMLYAAHHPLPYASTYTLRGFTQPTGFESALFGGRPLRSNRIFGRMVMR